MSTKQTLARGRPYERRGSLLVGLILALFAPPAARACDLCAIYTSVEVSESKTGLRLGVAEQFTRFGTLQSGGEKVPNPFDEHLNSSITQVLLGYNFTDRLGLQLNLPIISRTFRRVTTLSIDNDDETGPGDLSLVGTVNAYSTYTENSLFRVSLLGGLELPSGDTERLSEEVEHDHGEGDPSLGFFPTIPPPSGTAAAPRFRARHETGPGGVQSGIHGHDLALGSGSVDGIVGGQIFASWRKLFFNAAVQYLIRTEGDFDYEYADDLIWSSGIGAFVSMGHDLGRRDYTLGARAVVSGESKGKDTLDGDDVDDTAITSMFVGPGITCTWGDSLSADVTGELPVLLNNSSLQIVPDYRIRGGITWRF
jgi:hypothetical protein